MAPTFSFEGIKNFLTCLTESSMMKAANLTTEEGGGGGGGGGFFFAGEDHGKWGGGR